MIFICTTDAVEIFGTEDVNEGEQIQLTCYFTDEEISSLGWYKNQRRVLNSVDATSSVTYEERWIRADLTIGGAALADAGEYSCKAYTSGGNTETGRIKVPVTGQFIAVYHVDKPHPFITSPPYMVMLPDFLWDYDVTSGHLREIYGMMTSGGST